MLICHRIKYIDTRACDTHTNFSFIYIYIYEKKQLKEKDWHVSRVNIKYHYTVGCNIP